MYLSTREKGLIFDVKSILSQGEALAIRGIILSLAGTRPPSKILGEVGNFKVNASEGAPILFLPFL